MNEMQTRILVHRLEKDAAARPARYRFRVGALAALGYGYIGTVLLLIVGTLILLVVFDLSVAVKVGLPILFVLVAIVRALWVRIAAPDGIPLGKSEAGTLWQAVDRMGRELRAPKVHDILIEDQFNASILQAPRLGIFGWHRNYLILGLPLLQGLTQDQALAVIGHELGHLSRQHNRFGGWIYRLRMTWMRLVVQLEQQQSRLGALLFRRFFEWYTPYFSAYSFVLARADEYTADQCAAQVAGLDAARQALSRISASGHFLSERHSDNLRPDLLRSPEPPADATSRLATALQESATPEALRRYLDRAMGERTGLSDTHPSLADRLRGLGWTAAPDIAWCAPPAAGSDAATLLLSRTTTARLNAQLGKRWQASARDRWSTEHQRLRMIQDEIAALDAAAQQGPLSESQAWERISLTMNIDPAGAVKQLPGFVAASPNHALSRLHLGRHFITRGEDEGIEHLTLAARLDDELLVPAYELITEHLASTGRRREALPFEKAARERAALLESAEEERTTINSKMVLEPNGLPASTLDVLRAALAQHPNVQEAYLVRRKVTILPNRPAYLLGIRPKRQLGRQTTDEAALTETLMSHISWPAHTYPIILGEQSGWLLRAMRKVDGPLWSR